MAVAPTSPSRFSGFLRGFDLRSLDGAPVSDVVRTSEYRGVLSVEVVMVHEGDPLERLTKAGVELVQRAGRSGVVRVESRDSEPSNVLVWPSKYEGVRFLIGATNPTDSTWQRVNRAIAQASPTVTTYYLNQADLRAIPRDLETIAPVNTRRISAVKYEDRSSIRRSWAASRAVEQPDIESVLGYLRSEQAALTKILFDVSGRLTVHLRRLAGATFYEGSFTLFESHVLDPLARAATERQALLRDRARESDAVPARAVAVAAPEGLLADPSIRMTLADRLGRMSHGGVAVLHGNPYIHLAVTDYVDGSSFDVLVTDEHAIRILPGHHATEGALSRLVNHAAGAVGAVDVQIEPSQAPPTKSELLGIGLE